MPPRLRDNKDFLAGLVFFALGVAAVYFIRLHESGTAMSMQSGWFPNALGRILAVFGIFLVFRGLRSKSATILEWGWRPLAGVTLALLLFGFLLPRVGLIPALVALLFTAAMGGREFRLAEVLGLMVVLTAFAVVVFVYFLKLPFQLLPGMYGVYFL